MNVETLQGIEAIGKAKKKGFFNKIGEAFKKGASFLWKGAAKINPILVPARAAFLVLVKNNTGGVAKQMQAKGIDKAKKMWSNLGGDFAVLQKAVKHGAGSAIKGIGAIDIPPELAAMLGEVNRAAGVQGIGVLPFAAVIAAAKPILEKILSLLGIKLGEKPATDGGPPVADPASAELAKQLESVGPSPVTEQVQRAIAEPGTPNTGGAGAGTGTGAIPWVPIGIGAAALLLLTMNNSRRR